MQEIKKYMLFQQAIYIANIPSNLTNHIHLEKTCPLNIYDFVVPSKWLQLLLGCQLAPFLQIIIIIKDYDNLRG